MPASSAEEIRSTNMFQNATLMLRSEMEAEADDLPEDPDNRSIDGEIFVVLLNGEGQHCLWPASKLIPDGWTIAHPSAPKAQCLAFVEASWADMRPTRLGANQTQRNREARPLTPST